MLDPMFDLRASLIDALAWVKLIFSSHLHCWTSFSRNMHSLSLLKHLPWACGIASIYKHRFHSFACRLTLFELYRRQMGSACSLRYRALHFHEPIPAGIVSRFCVRGTTLLEQAAITVPFTSFKPLHCRPAAAFRFASFSFAFSPPAVFAVRAALGVF